MKVFARSLGAKITVSAALVVATLICVSVGVLIHLDVRQVKGALAAKAALAGRMVTDGVSAAVWNLSPEEVAAALNSLRSVDDFVGAVVHGTQGEIFFATQEPGAGAVPEDALLTEIIEIRYPDEEDRMWSLGTLRVSFDLRPMIKVIEQQIMLLASGGVFALLLMVGGTVYVMRRVTAPITRTTDVALAVRPWIARHSTVLLLWLAVSLFILILDNGLTLLGTVWGSVGWTFGRLEALISASFLLMVYLHEMVVLYERVAGAACQLARSNEELEERVRERTEALAQALAETQRARDTLEERVVERTRALEVATEEKLQAQAALQQAQKMEAIGQLTGGIAHDFNNLLTAVIGNLDLARRKSDDSKVVRLLDNATQAAGRGGMLTEQLLAFSRKQHLMLRPLDINGLVSDMGEMLEHTIGATIRIEHGLAADLWPAMADHNQIELAVLNLALNARNAMAVGGNIVIETANLPQGHPDIPQDLQAGDYVLLSVADTGTGMPEEVLARAFEPFFTTREVGQGSGLGLSMVEGMVKQSGGSVTIVSKVGLGTTVRLFLRRAETPTAPVNRSHTSTSIQAGNSSTILLVDDDRDVRAFTANCLTDLGYHVAQAASGRIALAMLENGQEADLLVLDFAMPGMNGAEVAERVHELRPDLPILFITGYAASEVFFETIGFEQILKKPFLPADIAGKVRAMLGPAPAQPFNILASL